MIRIEKVCLLLSQSLKRGEIIIRKLITVFIFIVFLAGISHAAKFIIEIKGSHFSLAEKAFQDIYGGGITFGGEVLIGLWKKLQFWLGGNYYSGDGELTYTGEETSLQILPIGGGLKYELPTGAFRFYGGFGLARDITRQTLNLN